MTVQRIVPVLTVESVEAARDLYVSVLGLREVMNLGWIVTVADDAGRQLSVIDHDQTAAVNPDVSIEVDDVDGAHAAAVRAGAEIVHTLRDEPWGVRRFFMRDGSGNVVNVLSHREVAAT